MTRPASQQAHEAMPQIVQVENGTHRDRRERMVEIQRARLLTAMLAVTVEHGAGKVAVAHVVERAGVSRRTFYELFTDCEDCFLATFDEAMRRVSTVLMPAYRRQGSWRDRTRAAVTALLSLFEEEPDTGRLLIIETLAAGPAALERRRTILTQVIAALEEGCTEAKRGGEPSPLTAEAITGGALSILHARILADKPEPLSDLTGALMSVIVLPYLGQTAARRELQKPTPRHSHTSKRPITHGGPLRDLDMRLTYRTVRVLSSIADTPGASNKQIADSAGVTDQGQVSKLLNRLQKLGLIENTGPGATRGAANAWTLTTHGQQIHTTILNSTTTGS